MKKKIIIVIFILISGCSFLFADIFEDFHNFRIELYNIFTDSDYEEMTEEFISKYDLNDLSFEDVLTIENMLLLEKLNFVDTKEFTAELFSQNRKCDEYIKGKKLDKLSSRFLSSLGDLKSRYVNYISGSALIKESIAAKKYYTQAIKNDKYNIDAYIGYGLWLYFAPSISGGGLKSSLQTFQSAEKCARTNYEKYFLYIYESQIYLAMGKKDKANEYLDKAHSMVDNESFAKIYLKNRIKEGKPFFDE